MQPISTSTARITSTVIHHVQLMTGPPRGMRAVRRRGQAGAAPFHGDVDLSMSAGRQRFKAEDAEKVRRRFVQNRAAGDIEAAAFADELFREQGADGIGAVDAADGLDVSFCRGLIVGDDRERLELRGREFRRLACLERFRDVFGHFSGRAHLIGVFELHDADAAAVVGEGTDEGFTFAVDLGFIYLQGFREAGGRDRFARGEEHGHQRALEIILFHNGSLSGADRLVPGP